MALLVIRGEDGRSHLIHSGDIGPSWRGAKPIGQWRDTWARFDRELAAGRPADAQSSSWATSIPPMPRSET